MESLRRKAREAKTRGRKKLHDVGPDCALPNCATSDGRHFPPRLLVRPDGEQFLLYDIGSSPEWVVIFGTLGCARPLQTARIWSSNGTFNAAPRHWGHVYTISAPVSRPLTPSAYGPPHHHPPHPPADKTTETYATIWKSTRAQAGKESADMARLLANAFEQDAVNAAPPAF